MGANGSQPRVHSWSRARTTAETATNEYERAAAASSAVLAAIAAGDAACTQRIGQVWKGEHTQAHTLLRAVSGAEQAASALQKVVSLKAQVQYLGESLTDARLTAALRQAEAVLDLAEQVHRS